MSVAAAGGSDGAGAPCSAAPARAARARPAGSLDGRAQKYPTRSRNGKTKKKLGDFDPTHAGLGDQQRSRSNLGKQKQTHKNEKHRKNQAKKNETKKIKILQEGIFSDPRKIAFSPWKAPKLRAAHVP